MKKILSGILALVAIAVTAVIADASIPGPNGVINSCVGPVGQVRVIDSADSCKTGETALNWNQTGPQGPNGATGPQGPSGISGYDIVSQTATASFLTVNCPTGQHVLGGGFSGANGNGLPDTSSVPTASNDGWTVTQSGFSSMTVYAICANVS